jgi:predicted alpha/beta hydrolase
LPAAVLRYILTHLVLRELAMALAERGQHVLRFDYRGTGDSFGELGEVTVSDWLEDIALGVREGREISDPVLMEEPLQFGDGGRLFGILILPSRSHCKVPG